jgi:hypothetical protein
VPAQQRRRGDQEDPPTIPGQQLRQHRQDHAVARRIPRPGQLSAQHGELVPQHGDLYLLRIGSPTAADHAEDPPQDKKRQGPHHHEVTLPTPHHPWSGQAR